MKIFGHDYSSKKEYFEGTHRSRSPAATVEAYRKWMPRMGITRLANVTGLDSIGVPVFVAFRPNAMSLSTTQGKGIDVDAARASALMETIESFHAENIDLPMKWDSYQRLKRTSQVVDVDQLARMSPVEHARARGWLEGWDLMGERTAWIPHDVVTMDFVRDRSSEFVVSANGLASGNHILEAVAHGLCEVIERDAQDAWDRTEQTMRLVDLDSVREPYTRELLERIRRAGVFVAAWDMTTDIGIPSFGALVMNPPDHNLWRVEGLHYGFGSHLEPGVALSRAVSEAVQTRLTYIAGSRDDLGRYDYEFGRSPDFFRAVYDELRSLPREVRLGDLPSLSTSTFEGDVDVILRALSRGGIEQAFVVDLTKEEFQIPVVRVVVPGLAMPDAMLPNQRTIVPQLGETA